MIPSPKEADLGPQKFDQDQTYHATIINPLDYGTGDMEPSAHRTEKEVELSYSKEGRLCERCKKKEWTKTDSKGTKLCWKCAKGLPKPIRARWRPRRNALCPCGSGKKYKRCHYPEIPLMVKERK